jgi:hypothetical protein
MGTPSIVVVHQKLPQLSDFWDYQTEPRPPLYNRPTPRSPAGRPKEGDEPRVLPPAKEHAVHGRTCPQEEGHFHSEVSLSPANLADLEHMACRESGLRNTP